MEYSKQGESTQRRTFMRTTLDLALGNLVAQNYATPAIIYDQLSAELEYDPSRRAVIDQTQRRPISTAVVNRLFITSGSKSVLDDDALLDGFSMPPMTIDEEWEHINSVK